MSTSNQLNWYDLTIIADNEDLVRVREEIERREPESLEVEEPEEVDLAYEIQDKTKAYMGVFRFKMAGSEADDLKRYLDEDRGVLRFMLLRDKLREKEEKNGEDREVADDTPSPEEQASESEESGSLTNEDIEEKIEELQ